MEGLSRRVLVLVALLAFPGLAARADDLGIVRISARVEEGRAIVSFNGAQIGRGLILTCGHCCRSAGGRGGRVTVHILAGGSWKPSRSVEGTVLCFDFEADCGLIRLDDPDALKAVYVLAPRGTRIEPGDDIYAFQWRRPEERLAPLRGRVTRVNPYLGPSVIETTTIPRPGESGGPLILTERREIIGVTSAADTHLQRGIYCGLESIYQLLDLCGQSSLVEDPSR